MSLGVTDALPRTRLPLTLHWSNGRGDQAIPLRLIRPLRRDRTHDDLPPVYQPNLFRANGEAGAPFDFSARMRELCIDVVSQCHTFHHIDMDRVLVSVTQARTTRAHGLQAKVTPMRFRNGELTGRRRGRLYNVQRYFVDGMEILYVITFCLPRFLNQTFDDKLVTIFHELYHIAPEFDGDLRRHGGRCCIHTHSQKHYDAHMAGLAREYLGNGADVSRHSFLRLNFRQLQARHGRVLGRVVPVPRLVPV